MKKCERCGNTTNDLFRVRSTLTNTIRVCWNCKYDIERFIKNNMKIKEHECPPIRYDVINLNGDRYIREDQIAELQDEYDILKLAIMTMPSWLDNVRPEVVRCKDCKHRYDNDQKCPFCNECGGRDYPGDDWFCADGERNG